MRNLRNQKRGVLYAYPLSVTDSNVFQRYSNVSWDIGALGGVAVDTQSDILPGSPKLPNLKKIQTYEQ